MKIAEYLSIFLFFVTVTITGCTEKSPHTGSKYWSESWSKEAPLNIPRAGTANGVYKNVIYVAGGGESNSEKGVLKSVEYTHVKPDGSLEPWKLTKELNFPRIFAAGVEYNGFFYVVGGEKGIKDEDLLKSIERGRILPDGSIESWVLEKEEMGTPRRAPVAFILGSRLYMSGGFNGKFLTDTESALIKPDGSIGQWRNEGSDTKFERYIHSGLVYKDKVLLFGGHATEPGGALNAFEWTKVKKDEGYLELWTDGPDMPTKRYLSGAAIHENILYLIGGRNSVLLTEVSKLVLPDQFENDIINAKWETDTPLIPPREAISLTIVDNSIYVIGGRSYEGTLSSVVRIKALPDKRLGHWTTDKPDSDEKKPRESIDAYTHFEMGNEFIKYGKLDYAIADIKEGLRLSPDTSAGYYMLGQIFTRQGNYSPAKQAFLKALKLKSDYAQARIGLGIMYLETGELNKAIEETKKGIDISPDTPEGHLLLGQIYFKQGKHGPAKKAFLKTLEIKNDFVQAIFELGILYDTTRDIPSAIKEYQKALELNPDHTQARLNLAFNYLKTTLYKKAEHQYEYLVKRYPKNKNFGSLLTYAKRKQNTL